LADALGKYKQDWYTALQDFSHTLDRAKSEDEQIIYLNVANVELSRRLS
jgi:hypothetical protein